MKLPGQDNVLLSATLRLLDAFDVTDFGPELVDARSAAAVAGFHLDRQEHLDGQSTDLDYAAAIAIYSTVLPSRPALVPRKLRKPLGRLMADDRDGHTGIAAALTKHAMVLIFVSEQSGNTGLARGATTVLRMGLDVMADDDPQKPYLLSNLGAMLQDPARDSLDDLDTAIEIIGEGARLLPDGDAYWLDISDNLTKALMMRYGHAGNVADLDAVIRLWEETAAQTAAHDRENHATAQTALAVAFHDRYEHSGVAADLDTAIEATQAAVAAARAGSADQSIGMSMLGIALQDRFGRSGALADLNAAVAAHRGAAQTIPADHPERAELLIGLGRALSMRSSRTGDLADLKRVDSDLPGRDPRLGPQPP